MKNDDSVYRDIHQDLIDSCRKKDIRAQFRVYRLYYKNMYNISLRIVNNPGEAEDIMQDSFLSAFENIESFSGQVSFGAWLKRIVINRSLDFLRKKKIELTVIEESGEIADYQDDREDDEQISMKVDRIYECIKLLPDGYRVILSLYLLEGYDHEEIGDILGISASTSRSQYTRARQKLYSMLKNKFSL
jgi:RNA polymerase sigma factor (sigma-70 family)